MAHIPAHISRHPHSGILYFRLAVPYHLRTIIGRTEIKRSLRTANTAEAVPLAMAHYLNAKRQFLQAESTMAKTDSNDSPHSWKLHNILTKILADGTVEIASTDINNDKDAAIVQATVNGIMSHHAALTSKNVSDSEAVQLIKALASEIQEQKNRPPEGIAEITLKEAVNK